MTTTDNHVTREQFRALEVYVVNQLPTREHLAELRTEVLGRFGQLDERLERVEGRLDQHGRHPPRSPQPLATKQCRIVETVVTTHTSREPSW